MVHHDESAFWADLLNGTFPNFAWFTPNMWNDGHYLDGTQSEPEQRAPALVDQAATWLESFLTALRFPGPKSHLPPRTLVVATFDEADFEAAYEADNASIYDGPNQIYTVLLGDMIEPGVEEEGYIHGTWCGPGGGLSMARVGGEVVLAYQPEAGGAIHLCRGRYVAS